MPFHLAIEKVSNGCKRSQRLPQPPVFLGLCFEGVGGFLPDTAGASGGAIRVAPDQTLLVHQFARVGHFIVSMSARMVFAHSMASA